MKRGGGGNTLGMCFVVQLADGRIVGLYIHYILNNVIINSYKILYNLSTYLGKNDIYLGVLLCCVYMLIGE